METNLDITDLQFLAIEISKAAQPNSNDLFEVLPSERIAYPFIKNRWSGDYERVYFEFRFSSPSNNSRILNIVKHVEGRDEFLLVLDSLSVPKRIAFKSFPSLKEILNEVDQFNTALKKFEGIVVGRCS